MGDSPAFVLGVFGVILAGALVYTWMLWRLWRGDRHAERRFMTGAAAIHRDPERQRGLVRGSLGVAIACWGMAVSGGAAFLDFFVYGWGRGDNEPLFWVLLVGGLVTLFGGSLLEWFIVQFNRPKFLVPPQFRSVPGMSEVRRGLTTRE